MSPAVYVDLDGVLADFVRGAMRWHKKSLPIRDVRWNFWEQMEMTEEEFWPSLGREFFAGLNPLDDGMELLRMVEGMVPTNSIGILTSAADVRGCAEGKRDWVEKHLPGYLPRLTICQSRKDSPAQKELHAGPDKLLIDDHTGNLLSWARAGGLGVLVPRPWNARSNDCDGYGDFKPADLLPEVRTLLGCCAFGPVS